MQRPIRKTLVVKKLRNTLLLMCCLFVNSPGYARGVSNDLHNFFNGLGFDSNITGANAYKGQQAGYYTGGSAFIRNGVRNYQLMSVQLPSIQAGCGGIDIYTGGFSFISARELVDAMKNIGQNAAGYAFMLGMDTVSPMISSELHSMQNFADWANGQSLNSCQAAQTLVDSAFGQTQAAQRDVCASVGASSGSYDDYSRAQWACVNNGQYDNTMKKANAQHYDDISMDNTNIAWKAIQKNQFLKDDQELAELFMSISGTLIYDAGQNPGKSPVKHYAAPSLVAAGNTDLIKALLEGGKAKIYQCDEPKLCLNVNIKNTHTINVSYSDAFVSQVRALLDDMYSKIVTDSGTITDQEKWLLQSTSLPLYKILTVEAAYTKGGTLNDIDTYSEIVAVDLLEQYLSENLNIVAMSSSAFQFPEKDLTIFRKGMDEARKAIREIKNSYSQTALTDWRYIEKTQAMERELVGQLSGQLSRTYNWSNGLP